MSALDWLAETVDNPEAWIGTAKVYPYFRHVGGHIPVSRRLRWPIGRAKPFEPWIATSEQVEHDTLTEAVERVATLREKVTYNHQAVDVIERMARRAVTATNKRQGWTPDGQSLEAGA